MIEIPGHSNFDVKIICYDNKHIISKSSSLKDSNRLVNQMKKQEILFNNNFLKDCKIPKILKVVKSDDKLAYYIIPYIDTELKSVNLVD